MMSLYFLRVKNIRLFLFIAIFLGLFKSADAQILVADQTIKQKVWIRADLTDDYLFRVIGEVDIQVPGHYRIIANTFYNSGDEQHNESYYMLVFAPDGSVVTPVDSNAGPYKVVPDDPGPKHGAKRDAGLFYLERGVNRIEVHHYFKIYKEYPQFVNIAMGGSESVRIDDVRIKYEPIVDGAVELSSDITTKKTIGDKEYELVGPNETFQYQIQVQNLERDILFTPKLTSYLPEYISVDNFSIQPDSILDKKLVWNLPDFESMQSLTINFDATVDEDIPLGYAPFILHADLAVFNDKDLTNNYDDLLTIAYKAHPIPAPPLADISFRINAVTDSMDVSGTDTLKYVRRGENIEYQLDVYNAGPDTAKSVDIRNLLPPFLTVESWSIQPLFVNQRFAKWQIGTLAPNQTFSITLTARLDDTLNVHLYPLFDLGTAFAENDTLLYNNFDSDIVYAIIDEPELQYDLQLTEEALSNISISVDNQVFPAVLAGNAFNCQINVVNAGPDNADNVKVWHDIPDSVTLDGFNIEPSYQFRNVIYWTFDQLLNGESVTLTFNATASDSFPNFPYPLTGRSGVYAANEQDYSNNIDSSRVYAVSEIPVDTTKYVDMGLTQTIGADSVIISGQDTTYFAHPGEEYPVTLTVKNDSLADAEHVELLMVVPNGITVQQYSQEPTRVSGDSVFWNWAILGGQSVTQIIYNVKVNDDAATMMRSFDHFAVISAANEDTTKIDNNTVLDQVQVYIVPPKYDLVFDHQVDADTSIIVNEQDFPAVVVGNSFNGTLTINNAGPDSASDVNIWYVPPDSVVINGFNIEPDVQSGDTLFWQFNSLAKDSVIQITFLANVADSLPDYPFPLLGTGGVVSPNENNPGNNADSALVYAIAKPILEKFVDLRLYQYVGVDSVIVAENDTLYYALPDEEYDVKVTVWNDSLNTAKNVQLLAVIPAGINAGSFVPEPASVSRDSVFWSWENLNGQEFIQISYHVKVNADTGLTMRSFDHIATVTADNEKTTDLENNTSIKQVHIYRIPDEFVDLRLYQSIGVDSVIVAERDTLYFAHPGEEYNVIVSVFNDSDYTARDASLIVIVPRILSFSDFSPEPTQVSGDSVLWSWESLAANSNVSVAYHVKVKTDPDLMMRSYNHKAVVSAANEDPEKLDNNSDEKQVQLYFVPVVFDLSFNQTVTADTTITIDNKEYPAVLQGDIYEIELNTVNSGPDSSHDVVVWYIKPDSVTLFGFNIEPNSQNGDTLFWNFPVIGPGQAVDISFQLDVSDSLAYYPYPLLNTGGVVAPGETNQDNNTDSKLVYVIEKQIEPVHEFVDLILIQTIYTDSMVVDGSDTTYFAGPDDTYDLRLCVKNDSTIAADNVQLVTLVPDGVTILDSNPSPYRTNQDSVFWTWEQIDGNSTECVEFSVKTDNDFPVGTSSVLHITSLSGDNEDPDKMSNNTQQERVYIYVPPPQPVEPYIRVTPTVIDIDDSLAVEIKVSDKVASYDIWAYLPDGSIDTTFADVYIQQNSTLSVEIWTMIQPFYKQPYMLTKLHEEQVVFELRVVDEYGRSSKAQATAVIRSLNYLVLDRNVYEAEYIEPLGIRFKLSSKRVASLDIYDINGRHVENLANEVFNGGWNMYYWDGRKKDGSRVGSGVYLVTLRSGEYNSWKKFILVR